MSEKIVIIGAGGLTGRELLKLIAKHPHFEVVMITSNQVTGKSLQEVFPQESFTQNLRFVSHEADIPKGATVVLATPNEASLTMAPRLLQAGHKVIDLSGTFRIHDQSLFESAYGFAHTHFHLMKDVVFGIPEMFRSQIKGASFVSNPGCFSTSAILPIFLLGKLRSKVQGTIIIDAKSGVSGAGGRTEEITFAYTNVYENFRAYKVLKHQHEPEISEYIQTNSPKEISIVFTPHLLPLYRGILTSIYIPIDPSVSDEEIESCFENATQGEPFLRFKKLPEDIELRFVQNSNYLDFAFRKKGNILTIVSALDNLMKGAAGQALQNLNLMHSLEETIGLQR
ncbi:N-acetyl-gamma-glutamyl-phosphate reductase [Leptospira ryugenii]|uniref:N-acetyl-gamma-glutamyl-phosphate reductase n=1 Tax=Leptospira ryugenii TaxID=1917863 RepID=A0A2P2DXI1_9LEPT|nr:N-acetyl-gamma-glutamyl-phosphate reductase [Leptospira ryugenii]GBF49347.1 N-acetyl-gamma-glutamyl-phosphate reductase [Leptospira ryugenii]